MNQRTKKNHYVPQGYLKYWTDSLDSKLYVYDTIVKSGNDPIWKKRYPKQIAYIEELYTHIQGSSEVDSIEQYLNRIETVGLRAIEDIEKSGLIDPSQLESLLRYVAVQAVRTPGHYRKTEHNNNKLLTSALEGIDLVNKINKDNKPFIPSSFEQNLYDLLPMQIKLEREKGIAQITCLGGKSLFLSKMHIVAESTYRYLNNHIWQIVTPEKNELWPTSDDPVILLNYIKSDKYTFDGGIGQKNVNIIFPLTPTKLLFTQIGQTTPTPFSEELKREITAFIFKNADRCVYSQIEMKEIMKYRKRVIDPLLYEAKRIEREILGKRMLDEERAFRETC